MNKDSEEPRFHIIQPLRDPESNWGVDVAKNLEEYLLKICSGEVTGEDDGHLSINFAEAALLLQGSVQVYSRKVEYLYTLVLHALEFLSQKRQQDQTEKTSDQAEGSDSNAVVDDYNEPFLGLDDVPVDAKNSLDDGHSKDDTSNLFVKPPANLVVLEGDCFDSIGDVGELESYLLATHDLYRDFILLDTCDVEAVDKYLEDDGVNNAAHKGSSMRSKTRKTPFKTPTRQSVGPGCKSPLRKTLTVNPITTQEEDFEANNDNPWPDSDFPENDNYQDDGNPEPMNQSDDEDEEEEDPWKPLNPHEPGNLKVKPFRKGKNTRRLKTAPTKLMSLASQFPVARLHGTINPEYKDIYEAQVRETEATQDPQTPPLYEKLRQSLGTEGNESCNPLNHPGEYNEDNEEDNDIPDYGHADFTMPETTIDAEPPLDHETDGGGIPFDTNEVFEPEDPENNESLEDLCRSHLDALLASIAETETQTELAARVSTWKQRIETTLEEQDARPPFDIYEYGDRVRNKLKSNGETSMSFTDVVEGQEKHEIARTFSSLLQLVNNREVDLEKGEIGKESVCFTAVNPFYVRPLAPLLRRELSSKKRAKSPMSNVSKAAKARLFK